MSDIPKLIVIDLRRLGKLDQKASLNIDVSFSNRTTARTVFSRGAPLLISLFRGQVELMSESPFELMTGSAENKPRPGGPSKLTPRAKPMIVRSISNKPMTSAQNIANELLSSCNVSVSTQTVRNVLHSAGLIARTPRKKPYVSEVNRKRRLEFAMKYKNKPMDFWKKVIFSDESKSEIFTPPAYFNVLRHNLFDSAKKLSMENFFIFQQDNCPKHTAIVTKTWLLYHVPRRLETPPQSPDLNPIENLRMHLDTEVRKKI
ncbi:transposable element Tcb1 transposase [Trichonephila clavipes]|nr:transposable element Tcb1 transposase [Trichonephila clavipes]